jgi:hypothetical protein
VRRAARFVCRRRDCRRLFCCTCDLRDSDD